MHYNNFLYFLATVEEMNISRAAKKLYITPQALSASIRKLEESYGVALFERTPRLKLTLAGERMISFAQIVLREEKKLNADLADIISYRMQRLILGVTRTSAIALLPQIWAQYHIHYPNVSLVHIEGTSDKLIELLQQQKVDFCICANKKIGGLTNVVLAEEKFYFAISKLLLMEQLGNNWQDFVYEHQNGIDLMTIKDFPLVMFPKDNRLTMAMSSYYATQHIRPNVVVESSQVELIHHFTEKGYGASILLGSYLYSTLGVSYNNNIFIFPVSDFLLSNTIGLIYLADSPKSKHFQVFINTVKQIFSEYRNSMLDMDNPFVKHNISILEKTSS